MRHPLDTLEITFTRDTRTWLTSWLRTGLARRAGHALLLLFLFLSIAAGIPAETWPEDERFELGVRQITGPYEFNLWEWEVRGLTQKMAETFSSPARAIPPAQRPQLVREYVAAARRIGELEHLVERTYADPQVLDPDTMTAAWREEIVRLRQIQAERRPAAEAILQEQIAAILSEERITVLGAVWPPVKFAFSEPPYYLIVSPRARIMLRMGVYLRSDLPLDQQVELERQVEALADVSALVEGIGGFGAFPTMVIDRASLGWILSTIAHEWTHNYLAFRPLGWNYYANSDTVTLNETVASIVGDEIGDKALRRFYPDLVPPPAPPVSQQQPIEPSAFDFGREMRATRIVVDRLLEKGYIHEAEAFMEARRRRFVAAGYSIRRLNQAYFAFHGSYATSPGAVDPIGPKLTRLREASPSLAEFLRVASRITSVEELDAALRARGIDPEAIP
ncbi:MAG: hypothetical protein Kow0047_16180 [Anaerolineae bacterium]